nr:hypothetical protein HmN_000813400 [Hymenolepis microstoma]
MIRNDVPKIDRRSVLRRMYRVNSGAGSRPVFQQGVRLYTDGSMPLGSTSNSDSNSTQIRENPSSSFH